jgi:hypothetical protein
LYIKLAKCVAHLAPFFITPSYIKLAKSVAHFSTRNSPLSRALSRSLSPGLVFFALNSDSFGRLAASRRVCGDWGIWYYYACCRCSCVPLEWQSSEE